MKNSDTIAAISTPPGEGGIGIVRISGPGAKAAGLKVFRPVHPEKAPGDIEERYFNYGFMIDPEKNEEIDNGFLVFMEGPGSYTGEDTIELHCHGGALIMKKVLDAVLKRGARIANPGEFTRQAFLNGKLDLAQAEAVIDLIRAQTEYCLSSARGRLAGFFSRNVNEVKEVLVNLLARIEAELDFPEDTTGLTNDFFFDETDKASRALKRLVSTYEEGRVIRDGVRVLILGRPNTGKSSLLNILLKEERAIVTEVPGTTRDVIEEVLNIRGILVRLMDTAGLREHADYVESIGIKAAKERIGTAQLILFVVDSSLSDGNFKDAGPWREDLKLLKETEGKKVLVVANKLDLVDEKAREKIRKAFQGFKPHFISALHSAGIEELKDAIHEEAVGRGRGGVHETPPGELVTSLRHKVSLEEALKGVERSVRAQKEGLPREFAATDLRWSINSLGEITGETTTEDILDRIFSEFCIGK